MTLLVLFAVVAGAGTALTPCVLPVLPGLLASAGTGGRRRPLGVILGLAITHTIAIVALASVIDGVGLPDGAVRTLAVVVLLVFGLSLLVPSVAARIEAPLTRLARFGPRGRGEGFWSGLVVGGGLGFVYAPCAGPILAAVVSVSATQGASGELVVVALGYAAGSALVLLAIAYGGRKLIGRLRAAGRGPVVQRTLGAVMVATAVAVAADLDVRFQTALANEFPAFVTNPTRGLERSGSVEDRLAALRGRSRFERDLLRPAGLPVLGHRARLRRRRPLVQHEGAGAARPEGLRGPGGADRLLDLHVHQLPAHAALPARVGRGLPQARADRRGRAHARVRLRARRRATSSGRSRRTTCATPSSRTTTTPPGRAWGNQYWPAKYLIDARGPGALRRISARACTRRPTRPSARCWLKPGADRLGAPARADVETASSDLATPETYLGYERAKGFLPGPLRRGWGGIRAWTSCRR